MPVVLNNVMRALLLSILTFPAFSDEALIVEGLGGKKCGGLQESDFAAGAPVGEWVLGYYSGSLNMNISLALSQGVPDTVSSKAADYTEVSVLDAVRLFCVINPDNLLYEATNGAVFMAMD